MKTSVKATRKLAIPLDGTLHRWYNLQMLGSSGLPPRAGFGAGGFHFSICAQGA